MEVVTVPRAFLAAASFWVGACLGSFFNVLIHRLPRGESIVRPGSRCPACGRPIRPFENIPLVSFVLLGGRCKGCREKISWRYPGVEGLTGAGYALIFLVDGPGSILARDLVLFSVLVPIAFIDVDHRIIPDTLSLGGLAAGLLLSLLPGGDWKGSLAGAIVGGGVLYGTAFAYERIAGREGMGGGDIKLIAMIGSFLEWQGVLLTIFLGSLLGVAGGLLAMRRGTDGLKTAIPFGPFLCAAALIARFIGDKCWKLLGL